MNACPQHVYLHAPNLQALNLQAPNLQARGAVVILSARLPRAPPYWVVDGKLAAQVIYWATSSALASGSSPVSPGEQVAMRELILQCETCDAARGRCRHTECLGVAKGENRSGRGDDPVALASRRDDHVRSRC